MNHIVNSYYKYQDRATPAVYVLLSVMLMLFATITYADQGEELPAIRFTPEEQRLVDAGFPNTKEYWLSKDFYKARDAILAVSSNDPLGLPRLTDGDGGLFSRMLVELDNATSALEEWHDDSETTEEFSDALDSIGDVINNIVLPIFGAYAFAKNETAIVYEREILSLLPFVVRQMGLMAQIMIQIRQELTAAGVEPPIEYHEKYQRYQALSGRVTNAMINVTINPGYKHTDLRANLFIDCEAAWISLMQVLSEKDREDATFGLDWLNRFIKNQEEREAITAIIGKE